jgi:colicin import membrane protein
MGALSLGSARGPVAEGENERKRLERFQKRQQRELAQIIANELRTAELREHAAEKEQADNAYAQNLRESIEARRREALEESHLREVKRKMQEEEESQRLVSAPQPPFRARARRVPFLTLPLSPFPQQELVAAAKRKEVMLQEEAERKKESARQLAAEKELLRQNKAIQHEREKAAKERVRGA